jgi:hypothetical protein
MSDASAARRGTPSTLAAAWLALSLSCSPAAPATPPARAELAPQWQDVFDGTPELYAVLRPQAIKRDAVYGTFFKNLLRLAQAQSPMRGATALEALEGADAIVVGLQRREGGDDAAIVLLGVPAHLDPRAMTDAAGEPLLRSLRGPEGEGGAGGARVPELAFRDPKGAVRGTVFVLPDRTWIGAVGAARERARQAFASPLGRPAATVHRVDPEALALVRVSAQALLRAPRLTRGVVTGPLTRLLDAVSVALLPGKRGVVATLQYADEDASAWAELLVTRLLDESDPDGVRPWLKAASVSREGGDVRIRVAVPPRLLEELPKATGAELGL